MEDERIVALYWQRDEAAIRETEEKYGRYLMRIARNILSDEEDSRESVNDTYWRAWQTMPPHRPAVLGAYLGKITRGLAIDRYRERNREKRRGSQYALSLSELEECVSGGGAEEQMDLQLLAEAIWAYLRTLPPRNRSIFLRRYYAMDSLKEIGARWGMGESRVKSLLYRTRRGLRAYLEKEGFSV